MIGGVSAHLFAVFQGLLKVLAGVDTNFTVTAKAADDTEFGELYLFKWTTLLIPPTTLIIINMVGVVAGVSDAINNGYGSWGSLIRKAIFRLLGYCSSLSFPQRSNGKTEQDSYNCCPVVYPSGINFLIGLGQN